MKCSIVLFFSAIFLAGCDTLNTIPFSPPQTPENWLTIQPFMKIQIGLREIYLVQPSSTIFVYVLGFLAIGVGIYFLKIRHGHLSRFWWGIALLLWGAGALFAGTSYEALATKSNALDVRTASGPAGGKLPTWFCQLPV